MPTRKKRPEKKSSLYPALHDNVSSLLKKDDLHYAFHNSDDDDTCIEDYDTNIMGRFVCHNIKCPSQGWSSKVVPVTIRLYNNQQYNARVYHQRCKRCQKLSRPILDHSYAERVAYRIKKWTGVDVDRPPFDGKTSRGPHQSNLCEGCKTGHCKYFDLTTAMGGLSV